MAYQKPVAIPVALGVTFPLLAILAVIARFWARRKKRMTWRADDWMLVPALLLCIANATVMLIAATNGNLGRLMPLDPHGFPIPNPDFATFQKCIYANKIISTLSIAVTRHAILLFYNRIFVGTSFKLSVWMLYALNTASAAAGAKGRRCVPLLPIEIYAIASIVIDVAMLAIPWPPILKLRMARREKVAVLGIFGLGGIVLAVAIGKCIEFFNVIDKISRHHQITYDEAPTMYWTIPETCITVVCACLPTLRPLFHGWSPESLVGSMKSAISLHSVGSKGTKRSQHSGIRSQKGEASDSLRDLTESHSAEMSALPNIHSFDEGVTEAGNASKDTDAEGYKLKDEP